jgi:hypothetical protein
MNSPHTGTDHPTAAPTSATIQDTLGDFHVLPLELREGIWLYIYDAPIVYGASKCDTKAPPLLCCSKGLREEILHTIVRDGEVKVKSPEIYADSSFRRRRVTLQLQKVSSQDSIPRATSTSNWQPVYQHFQTFFSHEHHTKKQEEW